MEVLGMNRECWTGGVRRAANNKRESRKENCRFAEFSKRKEDMNVNNGEM